MMIRRNLIYPLLAVLAFVLCGLPEALAQESTTPPPTERSPQSPQGQQPSSRGVRVDPSQAPIVPPASTGQQQPPAPTQQEPIYPEGPAPQTTPVPQQGQREPLGAATAGSVRTQGGGASRPAGSAIAPAKQHQVRSLLIKFGAIAAAGVALGTVYALSKGTPSVPPNSGR